MHTYERCGEFPDDIFALGSGMGENDCICRCLMIGEKRCIGLDGKSGVVNMARGKIG